ncbi:hypothetical protein PG993_000955 [Apiospora rasikravindrae]|uniref:Uncharacterized protein n=1 Tax=Apiospora rasikravindrae TaxID=990691 RepID=A0ABR1UCP3_9PEZI
MSSGLHVTSKKHEAALCMMRVRPLDWLRHGPIDVRDLQLINANPVAFVEYGGSSFVRKLECMGIVGQMGGTVVGFESSAADGAVNDLTYTLVNVNITAPRGQGFVWGYLSTRAENVRIFRGPLDTCSIHPWDAMILRNCTANTDSMAAKEEISSRKWDILAMKMCEDYDAPWLVVAVRDSGAVSDADNPGLPDCTCACDCGGPPADQHQCTTS